MKKKLKDILRNAWNEPRHFCFWLTLLSALGLVTGIALNDSGLPPHHPPLWLQTWACAVAACLAAGIVTGFVGFFLSWIPPIRRWLAWMLQRRFFLLACLATLVALFYTGENWRGKRAWEKFKSEQEAKGEPFDMVKITPPPVPDEQNFAMAPIVMTTYSWILDRNGRKIPSDTNVVRRLEMPIEALPRGGAPAVGNWQKAEKADLPAWQAYYRQAATRTNLFPVAPQPQAPAADVLLALSKYDSVVEELRQAGRRPDSRFPLNYDTENPAAILLPHLAGLKGSAKMLQLRAIAELEAGQTDQALEDVQLMLRLAEALRGEPILISHLVRISIVNLALQPVWEGLADHKWSDAQLTVLEQALKQSDFLADYHVAMRGERAMLVEIIDYLRRTRRLEELYGLGTDDSSIHSPASFPVASRLIPSGWFYQNQLRSGRFMVQWYQPTVDPEHQTVSPKIASGAEQAMALECTRPNPYNWIEHMLLPAFGAASKRFASVQVSIDLARVACALERHRLAHGQYPDALDALMPSFIAQLPHDILNGQPLRYRRVDPGQFVLYSVGWNETDDGGQVILKKDGKPDLDKGDWGWPMTSR
jgi:hypothetical protein